MLLSQALYDRSGQWLYWALQGGLIGGSNMTVPVVVHVRPIRALIHEGFYLHAGNIAPIILPFVHHNSIVK